MIIEDIISLHAFAVDRGQLYWADAYKKEIRKCVVDEDDDCESVTYQALDKYLVGTKVIMYSENISN